MKKVKFLHDASKSAWFLMPASLILSLIQSASEIIWVWSANRKMKQAMDTLVGPSSIHAKLTSLVTDVKSKLSGVEEPSVPSSYWSAWLHGTWLSTWLNKS